MVLQFYIDKDDFEGISPGYMSTLKKNNYRHILNIKFNT